MNTSLSDATIYHYDMKKMFPKVSSEILSLTRRNGERKGFENSSREICISYLILLQIKLDLGGIYDFISESCFKTILCFETL